MGRFEIVTMNKAKHRSNTGRDESAIRHALEEQFKASHPQSEIQVKRQNSVSIRIRIIDPSFAGMDLVDRDREIWRMLETLPARVQSQITMVLLLTPDEAADSFANLEFNLPIASKL